MKTFLYSLLLGITFIGPVWADTPEDQGVNEEHGISIEINTDDEDIANDKLSETALEHKIKGKVFSIIADIIDAADDDITEDEKNEIKNEIKEAIAEIKEIDRQNGSSHGIRIGDDAEPFFMEAALGAMAIFFIFGTPIMIIAAVLYSGYRKKRLMHDTINQYVSSGKEIPPEVLKGLQKEATPKSNLHRGLVMSGIGLGIFACFALIGTLEAAAFGLIPLFVGLAQLLIWKLESK